MATEIKRGSATEIKGGTVDYAKVYGDQYKKAIATQKMASIGAPTPAPYANIAKPLIDYTDKYQKFRNNFINSVGATGTKYDKLSLDELEKRYNDAKSEYEKYFGKDDKFGIGEKLIGSIRYASDTSSPDSGGSSRGLLRGVLDYVTGNAGDPQSELSDYLAEVSAAYHKRKEAESTFDDIIKSKDYSRFSDYISGDKTVDYEKIAKQINDETYRKGNFLDAIGTGFYSGVVQTDKAATSLLDMTIGNVAKAFGWKNNPVSKLNEWVGDEQEKAQINAAKASADIGDKYNILTTVSGGVANALPHVILAYATGGESLAVTLNPGTTSAINTFVSSAAKNPLFWTSFASEVGLDYEKAKENGASELVAYLSSIPSAGINAFIEVGGGIETFPGELKGTYGLGSKALKWAESALEEGGEEVLQDIVSSLTAKAFYDQDAEWISSTNEDAVFNPVRSMKEGFFGALVGGLMGGGQLTINTIVNANTTNELKRIGQIVKNTGLETDTINFAKQANTEQLSAMVREYQSNKSTELLGAMYQRLSIFVNDEINNVPTLTEAIDNFDKIVNNTKNKALVGSASSQIITRMINAGMDSESSQYMTEQIRKNANKTDRTETFEGVENQPSEVVEGAEETVTNDGVEDTTVNTEDVQVDDNGNRIEESSIYSNIEEPDMTQLSERKDIVEMAHKLGYKILFNSSLRTKSGKIANGVIDNKTKTIILNPNGKPVAWTLGHEVGHSIENTVGYADYATKCTDSKLFKPWLSSKGYENMTDMVNDVLDTYRGTYQGSEQDLERKAMREIVANFTADVVLSGDTKKIQTFLDSFGKDKNKVIEAIKKFFAKISSLFSGKTAKEINRLQDLFLKAADDVMTGNVVEETDSSVTAETEKQTKNPAEDSGVKYSIDTEYMELAQNPEKNNTALKNMVYDAAYDSGLRFVGLHGTPYFGFTKFEKGKSKKLSKSYKSDAFFFTNKYRVAETYSNVKGATPISQKQSSGNYLVALDVKNPLTVECNNSFWNDIQFEGKKVSTDYIVDYAKKNGYDGVVFNNLIDSANLTDSFREEIRKSDELKEKWSSQVVAVFDSNQIKSLDPVTYDDEGKIIPLSERFSESDDIRYSTDIEDPVQIARTPKEQADLSNAELEKKSGKNPGLGASHFAETVKKSKFYTKTMKQNLLSDTWITNYTTITDKGMLEKAAMELNGGGAEYVNQWFRTSAERSSPLDIAVGILLVQNYQSKGDTDAAIAAAEKLREFGTAHGQAVQLFSIISLFDPNTMTVYSQKYLDDAYEMLIKGKSEKWIKANEERFKLTEDDKAYIRQHILEAALLPEGRMKAVLIAEIAKRVSDKIPPTKGDTLRAIERISMLGNIKTQSRNIIGNAGMVPAFISSDFFGTISDVILSKKTGVRTKGNVNLFDKTSGESALGAAKRGLYESYDDFKRGINTKISELNRYDVEHRTTPKGLFEQSMKRKNFNDMHTGKLAKQLNGVARAMNKIDNAISFMLDAGDRPFFEMWFTNSINNQLKKNKVDVPTEEMVKIAENEALQRTWQDNSALSRSVSQLKRSLNNMFSDHMPVDLDYGLGDILIKFTKTPANLSKAMIDFSPFGFISLVNQVRKFNNAFKTGQANAQMQANINDTFGKAVTGSLIYLLIRTLVIAGWIKLRGRGDDDKDVRSYERYVAGIKPYSIQIGDNYYTYDWMMPQGAMLAAVADYMEGKKEGKEDASVIADALKSFGYVFAEQSFIRNLKEALSEDDFVTGIVTAIAQNPTSFIPTFGEQAGKFFDKYERDAYTENLVQTQINKIISKIPFARTILPKSVNVLGEDVKSVNYMNAWNAFLNVANLGNKSGEDVATEIYDVYKMTGDQATIPRLAPNSYSRNNYQIKMSKDEQRDFQKVTGQKTIAILRHVFDENLSTDEQAATLQKVYTFSDNYAKATREYTNEEIAGLTGRKLSDIERLAEEQKRKLIYNLFMTNEDVGIMEDDEKIANKLINSAKKSLRNKE